MYMVWKDERKPQLLIVHEEDHDDNEQESKIIMKRMATQKQIQEKCLVMIDVNDNDRNKRVTITT